MNLYVKVIAPEGILFEGNCDSVTASNKKGTFDILPKHSHFISLINKNLSLNIGDTYKKFDLDAGVLKCQDDRVYIYLGLSSVDNLTLDTV